MYVILCLKKKNLRSSSFALEIHFHTRKKGAFPYGKSSSLLNHGVSKYRNNWVHHVEGMKEDILLKQVFFYKPTRILNTVEKVAGLPGTGDVILEGEGEGYA